MMRLPPGSVNWRPSRFAPIEESHERGGDGENADRRSCSLHMVERINESVKVDASGVYEIPPVACTEFRYDPLGHLGRWKVRSRLWRGDEGKNRQFATIR